MKAASAHDRAVSRHETAAAFMDEHDEPVKAACEREAAARNREQALEETVKAAGYEG
jgi:hypothetical protein